MSAKLPIEETVKEMLEQLAEYRMMEHVYEFAGGVRIGLRPTLAGDAIYVMKIHTALQSRGEGAASDALTLICDLADQNSVTLCLEVEPFEVREVETKVAETSEFRRLAALGLR